MSVHLHARSSFSLLSSTLNVASLVRKNKELGFSTCVLTDYKVLHGVPHFLKECKNQGIKGIIGLEFPLSFLDQNCSCVLLARNVNGYKNLVKISSLLNTNHEVISVEELHQYSSDCFLIMYGEGGILESSLINEDVEGITILLNTLLKQLPEFYLALSYNDSSFWKIKNGLLKECAKSLGIKTVALNKIYYESEKDSMLFKAVNAIRLGKTLSDKSLVELKGRYILSKDQLYAIYDKEDLNATDVIAGGCDTYDLPMTSLPDFEAPDGVKSDYYLQQLAIAGLKKRFKDGIVPAEYIKRLKYELKVIIDLHFENYFLIVYDYIRYARKEGIYVGPGRGSAAGSLVAYCLGITHIDPIRYDLLFERFLNPERVSMPDIDTDFPDDKRDDVIRYVNEKYGNAHVARIVTFGTMGAKQVLRDVGRIMEMPLKDVDLLCKMIPNTPKMTLQKALEQPRLREAIQANVRYQQLYKLASGIEGLPRHTSLHAAGVVFAKDDLDTVVPLMSCENNEVCTQFTMEYLEELGLIKMDFLGLKNLTIIDHVVQLIKMDNPDFNIMNIPLEDKETYELIQKANTQGVFQFESSGMKSLLLKMKPASFMEVAAAIALYRPGPMQNIPAYIQGKENANSIVYPHEELQDLLKETYGVMIYQEQVMLMAQKMAGFSLAKADVLRKAMSKKKPEEIAGLREDFIKGCLKKGYSDQLANQLFAYIERFAGYGFNKSHSVAYGLVVYQMAYLKAHYPTYFYTELLNNVMGDEVKTALYINECKNCGIQVLPPSINESDIFFKISDSGIRYGLYAIKGIGANTIESLHNERAKGPFVDYFDFVARMNLHKISRNIFESLIDAGALDEFSASRKSLRLTLDDALSYSDLVRVEKDGQLSIDLGLISKPLMIVGKEDRFDRLEREKNALGLYLSEHPIEQLKQRLHISVRLKDLSDYRGKAEGFGCITKVYQHRTKKGDLMGFVSIMDESGALELVVMPNLYGQFSGQLNKGQYVYFNGKIEKEGSCLVSNLKFLERK